MSNQKGFLKIAIIIIVLILIGGAYFVFNKKDKDIPGQNTENKSSQSSQSSSGNLSTEINPKDYSLVEYFIDEQSPFYNQIALGKSCVNKWNDSTDPDFDIRLVKKDGEIIISSLRQLIFYSEGKNSDCNTISRGRFIESLTPESGKYFFLRFSTQEDTQYFVLRLDIQNLSVKKLPVGSQFEWPLIEREGYVHLDLGRDNFSGEYKFLSDGKRMIQWDANRVYFTNLETGSESVLYTAPQNQWLVSRILTTSNEQGGSEEYTYDVKVNDEQIIIGVHNKKDLKTVSEGWSDTGGGGSGGGHTEDESKLIKQIIIPIPN